MVEITYELSNSGYAKVFQDLLKDFSKSNDSLYLPLIPDLFNFKTNTIYLNGTTLNLYSKILRFCGNRQELINEKVPHTFEGEVLKKLKEIQKCYVKLIE